MQDRGLAAYIAELIGTLFLVFVVGTVVTLYVSTSPTSQTGSDFAVVGLVHAFVLFLLIIAFGQVSGGHFNPAVTTAAGDAADRPGRRGRLHPRPALGRGARRAAGQGPAARRGSRVRLRKRRGLATARRRTSPAPWSRGSARSCSCSRSRGGDEPARAPGVGAAGDRHHAWLRGDHLRPADRRLRSTRRAGSDRR